MKTVLKGSFTRVFQKMAAGGGGAFYQISPDVALTTCIQIYSKCTQKAIFWTLRAFFFCIQRPQNRGGPHENIIERPFTRFFQKMDPGGGGVLPDFTRRGTNYLHTTLLKTYPKSNFWTPAAFLLDSAPPK